MQVHFKALVDGGKKSNLTFPITTKSFNTEASPCAYDFATQLEHRLVMLSEMVLACLSLQQAGSEMHL